MLRRASPHIRRGRARILREYSREKLCRGPRPPRSPWPAPRHPRKRRGASCPLKNHDRGQRPIRRPRSAPPRSRKRRGASCPSKNIDRGQRPIRRPRSAPRHPRKRRGASCPSKNNDRGQRPIRRPRSAPRRSRKRRGASCPLKILIAGRTHRAARHPLPIPTCGSWRSECRPSAASMPPRT